MRSCRQLSWSVKTDFYNMFPVSDSSQASKSISHPSTTSPHTTPLPELETRDAEAPGQETSPARRCVLHEKALEDMERLCAQYRQEIVSLKIQLHDQESRHHDLHERYVAILEYNESLIIAMYHTASP